MATAFIDDEILGALRQHGTMATYVVKNRLNGTRGRRRWTTPEVLRRLKALERAGFVARTPTSYAVMISWKAV